MKLACVQLDGRIVPAVVVESRIFVGPASGAAPTSLQEVVLDPARWLPWFASLPAGGGIEVDPMTPLRTPLDRPSKIVAVGLNYADHAAEGNVEMPAEPLVFSKFPSAIIGPGEAITWRRSQTDCVDYEAELAVVIGTRARDVPRHEALSHVFGYTCLNDVSARDLQFGDGQWARGKSFDTFCPIGPWLVTADEVPDPQVLSIECEIGDERLQVATTADMYFGVAELIARISSWCTLEPGDIIATGTPPGVGYFREPRRLLRDGDEVVVRVEGVGELRNPVRVTS